MSSHPKLRFSIKILKRLQSLYQRVYEYLSQRPDETSSSNEDVMSVERARFYVMLCALMYGSNIVFTKLLQGNTMSLRFHGIPLNPLDMIPTPTLTLLRFTIASLCYLPKFIHIRQADLVLLKGATEIGLWCGVGFITQSIALEYTSASKVAFFTCLAVILVPIFDMYFRIPQNTKQNDESEVNTNGSRMPWDKFNLLAPILALIGVAVLEFGGVEKVMHTPYSSSIPITCCPL